MRGRGRGSRETVSGSMELFWTLRLTTRKFGMHRFHGLRHNFNRRGVMMTHSVETPVPALRRYLFGLNVTRHEGEHYHCAQLLLPIQLPSLKLLVIHQGMSTHLRSTLWCVLFSAALKEETMCLTANSAPFIRFFFNLFVLFVECFVVFTQCLPRRYTSPSAQPPMPQPRALSTMKYKSDTAQ